MSAPAAVVKTGAPPTDVAPASNGSSVSITDLIRFAIQEKAPVENLERLVALQERVMARDAALEFARALADFQASCPPIKKVKTAKIVTKGGGGYEYTYAPLEEIVRTTKPLLTKRGFSYGWDSVVSPNGAMLTVTCTLRHLNGHSTTAGFTLPVENPSAMSPQQKVGAALTFAQRKTLESVLGLNTEDDTDAVTEVDPKPINDDQLTELQDLVKESKVDLGRFLKYLQVASLADLPAVRYREAKAALEQKKQRRK